MSSAQGLVDLIWIYKYNEDYQKDREHANDHNEEYKADTAKLKEATDRTKKWAFRRWKIFWSLSGLAVLLCFALIWCIYSTKVKGNYDVDRLSSETISYTVVILSIIVSCLLKGFLMAMICMLYSVVKEIQGG